LIPPPHASHCLKEDDRQSVWLIEAPGEPARTLKVWTLTPILAAKLALGIAQPQRQVRGGRRLRQAGVDTPQPVGSWRLSRRDGGWVVELALEHVPGRPAQELLERAPEDATRIERCAQRVGHAVHAIASAGLLHRDLTLNNLIVDESDDDRVWVIDPVGVRPALDRSRSLLRMFDRLLCMAADAGLRIPASVWRRTLHAALGGQPRSVRRGVFGGLRSPEFNAQGLRFR
jgi:hypothetical protein